MTDRLTDAGYTVVPASGADDPDVPTVLFVSGYGVQTYVREDDSEAIDSLAGSRVQELSQLPDSQLRRIALERGVEDRSAGPRRADLRGERRRVRAAHRSGPESVGSS
jgi:hypothetical protein